MPAPSPAPRIDGSDVRTTLLYVALVLLLAVSGVNGTGFLAAQRPWPVALSVAMMVVAALSLLWRRRRPLVPLVVAGPLAVAEIVGGGQVAAYVMLFEALFEPVMHGSRRQARVTTGLAIAGSVAATLIALVVTGVGPLLWAVVLLATVTMLMPLLWGWEVRHHREARRNAESLAAAERELAETRASHAVETERRHIAHDLHDVIAGHLAAVSLHTGLAASLPEQSARESSLGTARDSAQAAMRDLRSLIGVLSSDPPGTPPAVTLSWDALVQRLRGRDPAARITVDAAAEDPAQVDPAVQAALLRITAEAVTNALRHGRAPITLEVRRGDGEVALRLTNAVAEHPDPGGGVGRDAIGHRARAVGGEATCGPLADGRWQVLARLPARPTSSSAAPGARMHDA